MSNLLIDKDELIKRQIEFFKINRGGDITYHGPGQIMGYPIFDLDNFFTDINLYLRKLEQVIINTLKSYNITGFTIKDETGVWVKDNNGLSKKEVKLLSEDINYIRTINAIIDANKLEQFDAFSYSINNS